MKKAHITLLITFLLLFASAATHAQGQFNVSMDVKNMHYWRGFRVSDGFVTPANWKQNCPLFTKPLWCNPMQPWVLPSARQMTIPFTATFPITRTA